MQVAVPVFVFCSGTAGLVYQVTWIRLFSTVFGNSTHAISVVVAVFMFGLALGAFAFGGSVVRRVRPMVLYGLVEIGIGLSALLVPYLLRLSEASIAAMYLQGSPNLTTLTVYRSVIAAAIIVVPTTLMGATLPVISDAFLQNIRNVGGRIGLLYGLNTLGALVGCLATGFWLIGWLGVTGSAYFAAALNLGIGIAACRIGRSARSWKSSAAAGLDFSRAPVSGIRMRGAVLAALFVSGFVALSYEVIWSRALGFVFEMGMSAYAFTVVLSVLLAGLGCGGLLYAFWSPEVRNPVQLFGFLQILTGASVLASVYLFARWNTPGFLELSNEVWMDDLLKAAAMTGAPSLLMGISFPLAGRIIAGDRESLKAPLGFAYAANTIGCVMGPLVTGFVLIPAWGSEFTLKLMITASVVTGLILWIGAGRLKDISPAHVGSTAAIIVAVLAADVSSTHLLLDLFNFRKEEIVYFREGPSDSVLATRQRDGIQLIVGGSIGAGSTLRYQRTDELLAYIPLLLHPAPRRVAVVGFGTGRTSGLYGQHAAVDRVDVVEIAQGALASGRDVFASFNQGALANPKITAILDDGFNFMKYGGAQYDVISLDPFSPRDPGSARLYSYEFLSSVKARMTEGGMVVMWAFPSSARTASLGLALKTFQSVFPHTTVWTSPVDRMYLFVATPETLQLDPAELTDRLAARPEQTQYPYHIASANDFMNRLLLDEADVQQIVDVENRPVFTIDRPNLEFLYLTDRSPVFAAGRVK